MTITIATRADVRQTELDRFVQMSIDIVNSIPAMTGNLGVRHTNSGLSWFTLTAWSDRTILSTFSACRLALSSTTLCLRRWNVARPATCDRCRRLDRKSSEFGLQSNDLRPEPIAFVLELNDSLAELAVLDERLGRFSGVDEAG
jgi:hypothetical protein